MRVTISAAGVALAGLLSLAAPTGAASLTYTGNLAQDDSVATFGFAVSTAGQVTLQSFSYAGGVIGSGATIAPGGFDLGVALFDAAGNLLLSQDDATPECNGVANDPVTNDCFDIRIITDLVAGEYLLAVTQFDNQPLGPDFAAGFSKSGGTFTSIFGCSAGQFCDVSADSRTSFWAVDVSGGNVAVVPAPAVGWLLGVAVAGLGLVRGRGKPAIVTNT